MTGPKIDDAEIFRLAAAMTKRDKPTYQRGRETYQLDDPFADAIDTMLNEQKLRELDK
ncbi:hypothetical protein [Hansschlegelia plantiphila]|uniref:Uncharacterized protein n=1 Tax=Hansschlegelia plantiphila TaxID=374655 RepID=A0A9W6J4I8_9HYPH|nr:hypothetical protein [Hansschlegelia plantiphila]GLK69224.1 hypothetical protein GCM10008179_28620 [Hansschlegelia plantiphila]